MYRAGGRSPRATRLRQEAEAGLGRPVRWAMPAFRRSPALLFLIPWVACWLLGLGLRIRFHRDWDWVMAVGVYIVVVALVIAISRPFVLLVFDGHAVEELRCGPVRRSRPQQGAPLTLDGVQPTGIMTRPYWETVRFRMGRDRRWTSARNRYLLDQLVVLGAGPLVGPDAEGSGVSA